MRCVSSLVERFVDKWIEFDQTLPVLQLLSDKDFPRGQHCVIDEKVDLLTIINMSADEFNVPGGQMITNYKTASRATSNVYAANG